MHNKKRVILFFLLPALLIYFIFEVVPVLVSIYFAFHSWCGIITVPLKFVGLRNFEQLFQNKLFLKSLRNVLIYVLASIVTQVGFGYFMAYMIYFAKKGTRFFKGVFFVPMVLPATAIALLWGFIFFPTGMGVLNTFLNTVGLDMLTRTWLTDTSTALMAIIVVTTWASVGYYLIIGTAALNSIPEPILESATMDGAGTFKRIFYIMIPLSWESIKISVVLVITGVLKIFDLIFVLTPSGGPMGATHVPATLMYNESFKYNRYGVGSAISTVIFVLSIGITLISLRVMKSKEVDY